MSFDPRIKGNNSTPDDYKREAPEVNVQRESWSDWAAKMIEWLSPSRPSVYSEAYIAHREIRPREFSSPATKACLQTLKAAEPAQHRAILKQWIIDSYQQSTCDITLSESSWGHCMDNDAMDQADEQLIPYLLKEIDKLIPHSQEAAALKNLAIEKNNSFSRAVFSKEWNTI